MTSFQGIIDDSLWERSASIGAPADEQHDKWRAFVLREVARVTGSGEINAHIFVSWPLRKAVRVGAPYDTVRELSERSDPTENQYEALRYAIADVGNPRMLEAALGGRPMPRHSALLLWAALAGNWDVLHRQLQAIPVAARDEMRRASRIINTCRVPAENLPSGFTVDPSARDDYPLRDIVEAQWRLDDSDNYPTAEGLDVRAAGTPAPSAAMAALSMREWLPEASRQPDSSDYAEGLGVLLEQRFADFKLIGSGAYGIVFAAHDRRMGMRVAVKVSVLADPANQTPASRASRARDELVIVSMLEQSQEYRRRHPVALRLLDWTRGRIDLHAMIDRIGAPAAAKRYAPGLGIYQLMETNAFDVTLAEWQRSTSRPPDEYHALVTAWLAVLLAQLLTLWRLFGLRHGDIKADNIMLWNLRDRPLLLRGDSTVVDVDITPRHRLRMPAARVQNTVPALIDFGMSSTMRPVAVGRSRSDDVPGLLAALHTSISPPWSMKALETGWAHDSDTESRIVQLFLTHPELQMHLTAQ